MFDFQVIKKTDSKASEIDMFLASLLADNDAAAAMAQLKTLWVEHVHEQFHEDDEVPLDSGAGGGRGAGRVEWGCL
jgi:hypothetical protein